MPEYSHSACLFWEAKQEMFQVGYPPRWGLPRIRHRVNAWPNRNIGMDCVMRGEHPVTSHDTSRPRKIR